MMPLTTTDSRDDAEEDAVFEGSIDCNPYDADARLRVPVVNIQVSPGCWILGLDPQELIDIAAKLRARPDRLHDEVLPALVAARQDWATRHPGLTPHHLRPADKADRNLSKRSSQVVRSNVAPGSVDLPSVC